MDETDSNELEAQIREALARKRPDQPARPAAPPPTAPAAAPARPVAPGGIVVDPNERLGAQPAQPPRARIIVPPAAPQPAPPASPPASATPAAADDGRQALAALMARSAAEAEGETQIPPPPGQVLGRIGVEQQPAPAAKEKPFRHPFFSGRRHLWPMLIIPIFSIGIVVVLFYFLNFELAGEGVVDIAPLIEAEEGPIKVRPTEEGGLEIPNQDKGIYDELEGETAAEPAVEQLVPPPEEPVVPEAVAPAEPALPIVTAPDPAATAEPATAESTATETTTTDTTATEPAAEATAEEPSATDAGDEAPVAATEPVIVTETAALPPGAFRIQLAAVRSEDGARATWSELQGKLPELAELQLFIERIDLGGDLGVFYRVQGGPLPDQAAAYDLCSAVAVRGQECLVVKP